LDKPGFFCTFSNFAHYGVGWHLSFYTSRFPQGILGVYRLAAPPFYPGIFPHSFHSFFVFGLPSPPLSPMCPCPPFSPFPFFLTQINPPQRPCLLFLRVTKTGRLHTFLHTLQATWALFHFPGIKLLLGFPPSGFVRC